MKNIVVLISGSGSNLQAMIDACARKQIGGTLRAVFSNKADAFGLERAREAGIPALRSPPASSPTAKRSIAS
ncbi:Phosphoribosylglycinamide formyltransferase [Raoultella terrigena]|uniref:phosphoribosylglycinamide formyltransferase 1 n=1 Tax=Raoultella terrigena TaxID=577 RepID=A0A3P8M1Y7_RAOTE|nr:Phosphoribosylglycinamide formyltransferase [Raoultella terrigena]